MAIKVPLLERFSVDEHTKQPKWQTNIPTEKQLKQLILQELSRILSSRNGIILEQVEGRRTVVDYGIPDSSGLFCDLHDEGKLESLAHQIKLSITAFEPRLTQIEVTVNMQDEKTIFIKIDAKIVEHGLSSAEQSFMYLLTKNELRLQPEQQEHELESV